MRNMKANTRISKRKWVARMGEGRKGEGRDVEKQE